MDLIPVSALIRVSGVLLVLAVVDCWPNTGQHGHGEGLAFI